MDTIRLFIIEDEPMIENQIKMLGKNSLINIIGTAVSDDQAISILKAHKLSPHVILCDLDLPSMNSLKTIEAIKKLDPKCEILVFLDDHQEDCLIEAIEAGASGYLLKTCDQQKIYQAIIDIFHGGTVIEPFFARKLLKYFRSPSKNKKLKYSLSLAKSPDLNDLLTLREQECLQIIAKGLSNHEAALVLNLSKATIRTHLEHIYQKLEVNNRVEAVTEGIRQGIINL
jgi:DNA-binding NarL/FixJ family response regulator